MEGNRNGGLLQSLLFSGGSSSGGTESVPVIAESRTHKFNIESVKNTIEKHSPFYLQAYNSDDYYLVFAYTFPASGSYANVFVLGQNGSLRYGELYNGGSSGSYFTQKNSVDLTSVKSLPSIYFLAPTDGTQVVSVSAPSSSDYVLGWDETESKPSWVSKESFGAQATTLIPLPDSQATQIEALITAAKNMAKISADGKSTLFVQDTVESIAGFVYIMTANFPKTVPYILLNNRAVPIQDIVTYDDTTPDSCYSFRASFADFDLTNGNHDMFEVTVGVVAQGAANAAGWFVQCNYYAGFVPTT